MVIIDLTLLVAFICEMEIIPPRHRLHKKAQDCVDGRKVAMAVGSFRHRLVETGSLLTHKSSHLRAIVQPKTLQHRIVVVYRISNSFFFLEV